jgi:ABC-type sugar transport system permease subunit
MVVRQLRDFTVAAVLAVLIAVGAFVIERNTSLVAQQTELAQRGAAAIAQGRALPDVQTVIVGPATPSKTRPYLRERSFVERIDRDAPLAKLAWKPLVASAGPNAKLFYDAANRFEREHASSTTVEMLADGTGRAIAVTRANTGLAIALTPPAHPAPFPLLVLIGVLGLGAVLAAAGAIAGGRAALLGTLAGVSALAVPCVLWSSWIAATAIFLVGAALAAAQQVQWTDRFAQGLRLHRTALAFLAPAMIAMLILVAAPFIIGVLIGFYDHHQGTWTFVGLHNFGEILTGGGRPMDDPLNFWFILGVTVLWTVANVVLHVSIGVALAMLLSRSWLRGKGIFRMLLIVPWAVPNYITALMWKGVFTGEYGAMNSLLKSAGLDSVSWFSSWAASFTANVTTNTWLGFPFMMVVALGALESIPKELYEAASVDGASAWQRFRHITLPHLRPALGPAVVLGSIWTFNQFNVIYLVSAGQPGGATNILVTDAYRWAFERGERYGMAAAYATIIFLILLLWTVFGKRITRSKDATA